MNGLSLGQIPFPQGHQPYTPPERRRRKRREAARRAAGGAPVGRSALRTRTAGARTVGDGAALSINPDGGTDYVPFLGVQRQRLRGAVGASVVSHTIGFILLLVVLRVAPIEEFVDVARILGERNDGIHTKSAHRHRQHRMALFSGRRGRARGWL